jgi:proline iminopeptidase
LETRKILFQQSHVTLIDERRSGRSQKLEDPSRYTEENLVEDAKDVRQVLGLGKIRLIGHSYGGVLAQAYALKYQSNSSHQILCSTFPSTAQMNQALQKRKTNMAPDLREHIGALEKGRLFGHDEAGRRIVTPLIA